MNYLSYDIEIYNDLPEGEHSLDGIYPSIAATCTSKEDLKYWYGIPAMEKETAKNLVLFMLKEMEKGFLPFTWNGVSFDFRLLAQYSGLVNECAELALNGVDGMLLVTFNKGFFLGLDTALIGAGLETKTHSVTLNSGLEFSEMSGKLAPKMWRDGEYEAVKTYLAGDVFRPLELISAIEKNRGIKWTSKTGRPNFLMTELIPVKDLFKIPLPDCSWMSIKPKPRSEFVEWIPKEILNKYGINP
jgi:hypothetical protein